MVILFNSTQKQGKWRLSLSVFCFFFTNLASFQWGKGAKNVTMKKCDQFNENRYYGEECLKIKRKTSDKFSKIWEKLWISIGYVNHLDMLQNVLIEL